MFQFLAAQSLLDLDSVKLEKYLYLLILFFCISDLVNNA